MPSMLVADQTYKFGWFVAVTLLTSVTNVPLMCRFGVGHAAWCMVVGFAAAGDGISRKRR